MTRRTRAPGGSPSHEPRPSRPRHRGRSGYRTATGRRRARCALLQPAAVVALPGNGAGGGASRVSRHERRRHHLDGADAERRFALRDPRAVARRWQRHARRRRTRACLDRGVARASAISVSARRPVGAVAARCQGIAAACDSRQHLAARDTAARDAHRVAGVVEGRPKFRRGKLRRARRAGRQHAARRSA